MSDDDGSGDDVKLPEDVPKDAKYPAVGYTRWVHKGRDG